MPERPWRIWGRHPFAESHMNLRLWGTAGTPEGARKVMAKLAGEGYRNLSAAHRDTDERVYHRAEDY